MRMRLAASSIRSMALSGNWRSVMYRCDNLVAAIMAGVDAVVHSWPFRPRSIAMVSSSEVRPPRLFGNDVQAPHLFRCTVVFVKVVAPTQCSSPRASAGLSILPASIAPSALPAPIMVCSSSINRMTRPSSLASSLSTDFRRFLVMKFGAGKQCTQIQRQHALVF